MDDRTSDMVIPAAEEMVRVAFCEAWCTGPLQALLDL